MVEKATLKMIKSIMNCHTFGRNESFYSGADSQYLKAFALAS